MELASLNRRIASHTQQTRVIAETLARDVEEGRKVETTVSQLCQIVRLSEERLHRMAEKTVVQELRAILDAEQELRTEDGLMLGRSQKNNVAQTVSVNKSQ